MLIHHIIFITSWPVHWPLFIISQSLSQLSICMYILQLTKAPGSKWPVSSEYKLRSRLKTTSMSNMSSCARWKLIVRIRVDCCVCSWCMKDHKHNHSRRRSPMGGAPILLSFSFVPFAVSKVYRQWRPRLCLSIRHYPSSDHRGVPPIWLLPLLWLRLWSFIHHQNKCWG